MSTNILLEFVGQDWGNGLSRILCVWGFPKHIWGRLGQNWFMGGKFKWIWSESSASIQRAPRPFLPKLFTHIAYFHCGPEPTKNNVSKMPQSRIVWILRSWICVDISIFSTGSNTLSGCTGRKSLLHKFSGQFSRQQVGRSWKCTLSLFAPRSLSTKILISEILWSCDCWAGPNGWGFFIIGQVRVGYWQKCRVAGGFGSGRSVEIFDRVFLGILFTLGYFRVFRVIQVFSLVSAIKLKFRKAKMDMDSG